MSYTEKAPEPNEEFAGMTFEKTEGGRVRLPGDPKRMQDCVIRAVAAATDLTYSEVRRRVGDGYTPGKHTTWKAKAELLEMLGWEKKSWKTAKSIDTIKFDKDKNYILSMNRQAPHSVAIVKGVMKDTGDSRVNARRRYEPGTADVQYFGRPRPYSVHYHPSKIFQVWTKKEA